MASDLQDGVPQEEPFMRTIERSVAESNLGEAIVASYELGSAVSPDETVAAGDENAGVLQIFHADPKKAIIPVIAMRWRYSTIAASRNRTIGKCLRNRRI